MRGLFINVAVSLGLFGSVGLLAISKYWWQAVIAAALCTFFLLRKVQVFTRAWRVFP